MTARYIGTVDTAGDGPYLLTPAQSLVAQAAIQRIMEALDGTEAPVLMAVLGNVLANVCVQQDDPMAILEALWQMGAVGIEAIMSQPVAGRA